MESEKVKAIKKALECCQGESLKSCEHCPYWNWCKEDDGLTFKSDILTLINELESENERLKWEKQTLEDKDTLLAKVGEMVQENQQLKDRIAELESKNLKLLEENENLNGSWENARKRIAELENENKILRKHNIGYYVANNYEAQEQLKEFVERLKENNKIKVIFNEGWIFSYVEICKAIDETLKEFMDGL